MITDGEKYFFDIIKNDCNIIFDVGCRQDIYYIENAPHARYYLFEPNICFFDMIKEKIKDRNINIQLSVFGLSNKTGSYIYYLDTQSFFKRTISNPNWTTTFQLKDFSEYLKENNIEKIDFLKLDVEGSEFDILTSDIDFIKNKVKFVQFEYASTWYDREDKANIFKVYNLFSNEFDFLMLYNRDHPVSEQNKDMITGLQYKDLEIIESYVNGGYGFEIVMVKKGLFNIGEKE